MKQIKILFSLFALALLLNSCGKADTTLTITLKDDLGSAVSGASVKLYPSQSDWEKRTNQVGSTQTSDASGKVSFSSLSSIKYSVFAEKDCYNNANGGVTLGAALTEGKESSSDLILSKTGSIKLTSTSSNPYRIYFNGVQQFYMDGGTTRTVDYLKEGAYSVRVLQLSGYAFTPTDKTFNGDVKCGTTLNVTYP
ncbi:MAG: hypothetical protein NTX03_07405 [Bacteroidetes bacterium]|nr:hypothetical protein [Bacteroidota bacterium]